MPPNLHPDMNVAILRCDDGAVRSWDGSLADGTSVFAADRMNGAVGDRVTRRFSEQCADAAGAPMPVFELSCDSVVTVVPSTSIGMSIAMPNMQRVVTELLDEMIGTVMECRLDGRTQMSEAERSMKTRAWQPDMWFKMLTADTDGVVSSMYPSIVTVYETLARALRVGGWTSSPTVLDMPEVANPAAASLLSAPRSKRPGARNAVRCWAEPIWA